MTGLLFLDGLLRRRCLNLRSNLKKRVDLSQEGLPKEIRQFIFAFIDSVEQLEVLLFLQQQPQSFFSSQAISDEFRSSRLSIENRLEALISAGLVEVLNGSDKKFRYFSKGPEVDQLISQIREEYKRRPQWVMELIFSPLKKAREFAEAFLIVAKGSKGSEENNG